MSREYSDGPAGSDAPNGKGVPNESEGGARRRYWGPEGKSNGAKLPHWTDPPTGEIPKIYGLNTSKDDEVDPASVDEGALSFKRERRLLERSDQIGSVHDAPDAKGRHFGHLGHLGHMGSRSSDQDTIDLTGLDRGAGVTTHGSDIPTTGSLRVISSRPIPLWSRQARVHRSPSAQNADTSEIAKPTPARSGRDFYADAGVTPPVPPTEMQLPERRRPQFKRPLRKGAKRSGPKAKTSPVAPEESSKDASSSSASVTVRVVTGLGLGAVLVIAFLLGHIAVLVAVTLAIVLATAEYYRLVRQEHVGGPKGGYRPAVIVGLIGTVGAVVGAYLKGPSAIVLVFSFTLLASFLWYLLGVLKAPVLANASITFMGVAWIGLGGAYAAAIIRPLPTGDARRGLAYMMSVLIVVAANDVFAYFGGMVFGKRKLAPKISPAKTVEGLLVGGAGAILAGALIASHIHPVTMALGGMIGLLAAIGGPCGDLVESKIKREIGAKDAGSLLPGHGGMLDRLDGLVFVTPLVFYMLYFTHHIA